MSTFYLILRVVDIALYIVLIVALVMRFANFDRHGLRWFGFGLYGFMAASAWATIEVMSMHIPGGPRLIVLTIPLIAMAANLYGDTIKKWRGSRGNQNVDSSHG